MAKIVEMHVQEARELADCLEAETAESEADRLRQELGQTQGERQKRDQHARVSRRARCGWEA
jgi:hypothetical protein